MLRFLTHIIPRDGESVRRKKTKRNSIWTRVQSLMPIALVITAFDSYSQQSAEGGDITPTETTMEYKGPRNIGRDLSLKEAIEKGLRLNPDEQIRDFQFSKLDLQLDGNWDAFWLPNITLQLSTDNQNLDRFKTVNPKGPVVNNSSKAPAGTMGLSLGDYTLFNWGKDYLAYVNNMKEYQQQKIDLKVERRRLKFQIIDQFFNVGRLKKILRFKSDQLKNTSFVYRLAREKAQLKKIEKQEYYEARTEFLRAQREYHETKSLIYEQEAALADLIGDKTKPHYRILEGLQFSIMKYPIRDAIKQSKKTNAEIMHFRQKMNNAKRTYNIAKKDSLPLPKISVNLGTYKKTLSPNGSVSYFETHNGNSNVEMVASINFTIDIMGDGGFLNQRVRQQAYLDQRISEVRFMDAKRVSEIQIRQMYRQIKQLERLHKVAKLKITNTRKAFDETLNNYLDRKKPFVNFRIQLINYIESVEEMENIKYQHLVKKLMLADLIGKDDFPGEAFQDLASRLEKL